MFKENIGQCKHCGKRIRFIKMKSGKTMPVNETFINYKKVDGGKERVITPSGDTIACITNVDIKEADGKGYISHFVTCSVKR